MRTKCLFAVFALAACEVEGELDEFDSGVALEEDEDAELDVDPADDAEEEDEDEEAPQPNEVKPPCANGSPSCGPGPTARPH
ncbi:hypothetical protein SAMN02745121_08393 [Nannocystis exedens]|uniref:Uncharacterized protein n=2 Tax=Nannocystis exedens TaxID=54 RepID=A0A1I2I4A6_9BACT|nr:hypothetical protein NAEX_08006 [Nannocystis exedens]SFF36450.1 hypothetical protein SAMN02745121_08393 [Nannocystis exedens]